MSLSQRVLLPELMDDPSLEESRHYAALDGLRRINWASASTRLLWSPIRRLAGELNVRKLRVLDIATGGGDVPLRLWRNARRHNLDLDFVAADISPRALEFARAKIEAAGADIELRCLNPLIDDIPEDFDVVMCSLFLHHLGDRDARGLLATMAEASRHLVLVHDLLRCRRGLALAYLATRLLSASDVVHTDGPRSVRAAFSINEVRELANEAGMSEFDVRRHWPFRYLLQWRR